jgi:two-component system chemotaxis response regulator CheB
VAPGGKHFKVSAISGAAKFGKVEITDDAPENFCKPSVDYLFRSLSVNFPGKVIGVIMTGMGSDGTTGLKLLKRKGAVVIGQDMATSTVYGMPNSAKLAGVVDVEVPLELMVAEIIKNIRR